MKKARSNVHAAQNEAVQALATRLPANGQCRESVGRGGSDCADERPGKGRGGLAPAVAAGHESWSLYSGDLNEVLHANYREFGYAKAAQLMTAQSADGTPLAQSVSYGNGDRRLSLVIPLGSPSQVKAWAWVELPFAPLQQRFESISPAGGRLDLRQGDDRGQLQLLSHGASVGRSRGQ
jgi:phosphomannomutase/phosphoglucomutase